MFKRCQDCSRCHALVADPEITGYMTGTRMRICSSYRCGHQQMQLCMHAESTTCRIVSATAAHRTSTWENISASSMQGPSTSRSPSTPPPPTPTAARPGTPQPRTPSASPSPPLSSRARGTQTRSTLQFHTAPTTPPNAPRPRSACPSVKTVPLRNANTCRRKGPPTPAECAAFRRRVGPRPARHTAHSAHPQSKPQLTAAQLTLPRRLCYCSVTSNALSTPPRARSRRDHRNGRMLQVMFRLRLCCMSSHEWNLQSGMRPCMRSRLQRPSSQLQYGVGVRRSRAVSAVGVVNAAIDDARDAAAPRQRIPKSETSTEDAAVDYADDYSYCVNPPDCTHCWRKVWAEPESEAVVLGVADVDYDNIVDVCVQGARAQWCGCTGTALTCSMSMARHVAPCCAMPNVRLGRQSPDDLPARGTTPAEASIIHQSSVHGCCVIWCYASPGLSFRWCLVLGLCDLLVGPIGLIVGVSCLLCSSALPGVWSFLRVTPASTATMHASICECAYTCVRTHLSTRRPHAFTLM